MARVAADKKPPRIKVPPSWSGGKCMCCGKIYDVRKGNFSKTKSQWYMGNDGYLPWCNECREKMFEFYVKKYNDEDEAIDRLAMMFDTYVNDKLLDASEHSVASALKINTYMGRLNIRQYADKSYDDVIDQKKKDALAAGDTKGTKVTQRMIKNWGVVWMIRIIYSLKITTKTLLHAMSARQPRRRFCSNALQRQSLTVKRLTQLVIPKDQGSKRQSTEPDGICPDQAESDE